MASVFPLVIVASILKPLKPSSLTETPLSKPTRFLLSQKCHLSAVIYTYYLMYTSVLDCGFDK